ncbi:uncharacterized protein Z518_05007 [Rhinocladiella mackenziei CBS 650.93]|uniref:Uncharacterized protein n=1 Tax=Rhinocladiella mackenziei CBS 650.93 TaxID=1442369 RepID=A0A0D2JD28_9EURO|nr:uncharacterized protein Z518_05007 [Rhinocladiella mackenziei CBS 650.93]KIX07030.1 hypothetical protein Z518_05007 [Rhinocladiella mackenziei CBS 650.93]
MAQQEHAGLAKLIRRYVRDLIQHYSCVGSKISFGDKLTVLRLRYELNRFIRSTGELRIDFEESWPNFYGDQEDFEPRPDSPSMSV